MSLLRERMRDPTHLGPMADPDGEGAVGNPACGDVLRVYLRVDGERIQEARFDSLGSPYQLATASVLCDCVVGSTVPEARRRTRDCVLERLPDLPQRQHHLAQLAVDALHYALDSLVATPDGESAPPADEETACRFVLDLLERSGPLAASEVETGAAAAGVQLPASALRILSGLRRDGRVQGVFDAGRRAWIWQTAK